MKVTFYTKKNCPLCEEGLAVLKGLSREFDLTVEEIDIYEDDALLEKYQLKIPVIEADGHELDYGRISSERLRRGLDFARTQHID